MNPVDEYLKNLFGTQETKPKSQDEQFVEKLASAVGIPGAKKEEPKTEKTEKPVENKTAEAAAKTEDSMGDVREQLEKLTDEELVALYQEATTEKTAEAEGDDMTEEQAWAYLETISAQDVHDVLTEGEKNAESEYDLTDVNGAEYVKWLLSEDEPEEKVAEETDEEWEEIDPNTMTVAEFNAGLESGEIQVMEKEAETEKEMTDEQWAAHLGAIMYHGMKAEAEADSQEKTAEVTREDLVNELESMIDPDNEKTAGGKSGMLARLRALAAAAAKSGKKGFRAAEKAGKKGWKGIAKRPGTAAAVGAGTAGAGVGGYAILRKRKSESK